MDPLSITSAVISITQACFSTASTLNDIRNKYTDAPTTIISIYNETVVVRASLAQLQRLIESRNSFEKLLQGRPELETAFDSSLTGCGTLFSCIDDEITRVTKNTRIGDLSWRSKARLVWNYDRLRQYLDDLRGRQAALGTLINLLQLDSHSEIKRLLEDNKDAFDNAAKRTQELRESHPDVSMSHSVYSKPSHPAEPPKSIGSPLTTDRASYLSEREFDFDDEIVNSKVYRRMLAQAMDRAKVFPHTLDEALKDLSEDIPHREVQADSSLASASFGAPVDQVGLPIRSKPNEVDTVSEPVVTCSSLGPEASELCSPLASSNFHCAGQRDIAAVQDHEVHKSCMVCDKCRLPQDGEHVRALGTNFHKHCFTCDDCGAALTSKYFTFETQSGIVPLCETDYFRRLDLLCYECGLALRESYIAGPKNRRYHPEHFGCSSCRQVFRSEDRFYEHEGSLYCYEHYLNFAARCSGCNQAILGQGIELFGHRAGISKALSAPSGRWHPRCFTFHATSTETTAP